ncbi:hypothetical protein AB0B07_09455 [Streptomyces sioyaensis]|uniref:hypothetical protein n=1 Tax=Streptomyces sioyaensis TaxID=67364 RepID=UPI0033EFCF3C
MDQPADPMTTLAEAATGLHELYESFIAAGFTRDEALEVIKAIVVNGQCPA